MYSNICKGIFIKRLNRFIALVYVNESLELVHVKTTGRCKEILQPGVLCYLEKSNNPNRKTKYSLISVEKNHVLINIDSQVPNQIIYDAITKNYIFQHLQTKNIKREVPYGSSRFDISFYSQTEDKNYFLEVKGVTLEENRVAKFPDAPTTRGTKHVKELIQAKRSGFGSIILFLVQLEEVDYFTLNYSSDQEFSKALELAEKENVSIFAYNTKIQSDNIELFKEIPVILNEKYSDNFRI
ncbi:DNA/RNA nuclease SfsA [Lagierella sp.]|uniref:DNA/RNA nuclease SfsA n=1 Tax=Lagierella sp. TaxID=2849657 RepID=UPI00262A6E76|nr:DNA/RNA nuclease SfsA [Lagierella sp.]